MRRLAPDDQRGFALVLVLLALMVLAGIASAALAAALGQLRAASQAGRVLSGQTWAASGLEEVIDGTRGQPAAAVGGPAVELLRDTIEGGGVQRVLDLRVSPEFHLLVGEASWSGAASTREARVVWWLDPETRIGGHRAVLEAATVDVASGARVRTDLVLSQRPGIAACGRHPALARSFARLGSLVDGPLPTPPEWGAGSDAPEFGRVRLGRFSPSMLEALADARLSGDGMLQPVCAGCPSTLVFAAAGARLRQAGSGVLVADGDLALEAGSSWTGLLLASGDVVVGGGSRVTGLLRAGGRLTVSDGAEVDGSACAALEAVRGAVPLARPVPLPGRTLAGPLVPAGGPS